ncbi:MAG: hypothetical protein QOJ92_3053 [Frankiales bacterium]|nr:hypothetical protein [Frankiales bacterium]
MLPADGGPVGRYLVRWSQLGVRQRTYRGIGALFGSMALGAVLGAVIGAFFHRVRAGAADGELAGMCLGLVLMFGGGAALGRRLAGRVGPDAMARIVAVGWGARLLHRQTTAEWGASLKARPRAILLGVFAGYGVAVWIWGLTSLGSSAAWRREAYLLASAAAIVAGIGSGMRAWWELADRPREHQQTVRRINKAQQSLLVWIPASVAGLAALSLVLGDAGTLLAIGVSGAFIAPAFVLMALAFLRSGDRPPGRHARSQ